MFAAGLTFVGRTEAGLPESLPVHPLCSTEATLVSDSFVSRSKLPYSGLNALPINNRRQKPQVVTEKFFPSHLH
jgi:hypothetical protein